jgi:Taurine catabolism dioxygenase TauD, TfdA family
MEMRMDTDETTWKKLIEDLPATVDELSAKVRDALETSGFLHLRWPMSMESYEAVASRLGTIVQKSDVKVDLARAQKQEEVRVIKGRGGIYSNGALNFHTDPIADLVSWYCLVQDDAGGPMLMLDLGDLQQHFSAAELETLCKVELWMPSRNSEKDQETLTPVPLLSKVNGKYKIFYASWLLRESPDAHIREVMDKFAAYLKDKEETQLITLPVKPTDTVFLDNHRMLHGRGELATASKRHLVRFYLRAA